MAKTKIEWADYTFNPWIGCSKVSDGCKHCYAEAQADHRWGKVKWGAEGKRIRTSDANWKKTLKWNREAKRLGVRYRVFCASLADVFEDKADQPEMNDWRRDLFQLIIETPYLNWLLLTKRPENVCHMIEQATGFSDAMMWIPDNVWFGTSVENQKQADNRIPELLNIPSEVHFLSCEPLLGPVDLTDAFNAYGRVWSPYHNVIDWVIAGGESGRRNARPMHPDWIRSIRDQCQKIKIPFFFKQWGEFAPLCNLPSDCLLRGMKTKSNWYWHDATPDLPSEASVKVGRKLAGRLLDGREWNEFPGE